jgi:hypothetical protein
MTRGDSQRRAAVARPARRHGLGCWVVVSAGILTATGWLAIAPRGWAGHGDREGGGNRDRITIVLPPRLAAGENATLAVVAPDGKLMAGITVALSSGTQVTTDATGRAQFAVPIDARVLLARLVAAEGSISRPATTPKNAEADSKERQAAVIVPPVQRSLEIVSLPPWVAVRDRFAIRGFGFMGDARANKIFIGEQPRLVLASSSLALVVAGSARAQPGSSTVVIQTKDGAASATLTLVGVEMTSNPGALAPGKNGTLEFRVIGTDQPRAAEVRNLSPEVLRLLHGNFQRVESSGGAQNITAIAARGLRGGDFSVDVRLAPAAQTPDIEAAKTFLEAAHARGDHRMQRRIAEWIADLGDQNKIARMTKQMEKAADHAADADSAALIRAAQNAIGRGAELH